MKTILAILLAGAALSGCVVLPMDAGPGVYAAPPPVIVAPRPYYYGHYGPRYRYWR
jgi:hypothetical protein